MARVFLRNVNDRLHWTPGRRLRRQAPTDVGTQGIVALLVGAQPLNFALVHFEHLITFAAGVLIVRQPPMSLVLPGTDRLEWQTEEARRPKMVDFQHLVHRSL